MDFSRLLQANQNHQGLLITAGVLILSVAAFALGRSSNPHRLEKSIVSPRETLLPKLSQQEQSDLPYPPDVLPGATDVASPYGSLRVYEWGPVGGKKVLLVHGISTPCISLGGVAHRLVDAGYRVMLMDLWGRGYSDVPTALPHDTRLDTTAILLALASSPLSWTGELSTFSLIGYSLGGGIAVSFLSYFPTLVSSLILIAPAGLVREYHITTFNKFLYSSGFLPDRLLEWGAKKRLKAGPLKKPVTVKNEEQSHVNDTTTPVAGELPRAGIGEVDGASMSRSRPHVNVAKAVSWQVDNHHGFIKAFMSSLRFGPITGQHEDWRRVGQRLAVQNTTGDQTCKEEGVQHGQVLIICGRDDLIILKDELEEDAADTLGVGNFRLEVIDAGHDLPITKSEDVVRHIRNFWKEQ